MEFPDEPELVDGGRRKGGVRQRGHNTDQGLLRAYGRALGISVAGLYVCVRKCVYVRVASLFAALVYYLDIYNCNNSDC